MPVDWCEVTPTATLCKSNSWPMSISSFSLRSVSVNGLLTVAQLGDRMLRARGQPGDEFNGSARMSRDPPRRIEEIRMRMSYLLAAAAFAATAVPASATISWSTNQALGQGQTVQLANDQTVVAWRHSGRLHESDQHSDRFHQHPDDRYSSGRSGADIFGD